ncbi:hypothetical protein EV127DRAFT_165168 [Xylaria flabelliformis]|nr:hypothetical protein EV127DRAFT_165168 [Xylaria flabelliformis]
MAEQVAYIQELLGLIAQHTKGRRTLYSACLVSHAFHEAFTPYLYKDLWWLTNKSFANLVNKNRYRSLLHENTAKHARTLAIRAPEDTAHTKKRRDQFHRTRSAAITDICQHGRRLHSFFCSGVLFTTQCLEAVSRLPHLEKLIIVFHPPGNLSSKADYSRTWDHLAFANLRELTLLELYGPMDDWRDSILQIILRSPNLEHLGLSMSEDHVSFACIAEQYKNRQGHKLRLKILRLGPRI